MVENCMHWTLELRIICMYNERQASVMCFTFVFMAYNNLEHWRVAHDNLSMEHLSSSETNGILVYDRTTCLICEFFVLIAGDINCQLLSCTLWSCHQHGLAVSRQAVVVRDHGWRPSAV